MTSHHDRSTDERATYLVAVPLPDAASLVAPWRHTNRLGAHVTLLAPFASSPIDAATRHRFARHLRREPRFPVTLHSLGWFDQRVVYVLPDQGPRWEKLARAAADSLNRATDATATPHVTVAKGLSRDELAQVAARTSVRLPWNATARSAVLYQLDRSCGRWHPLVRAAFAGASPAGGEPAPRGGRRAPAQR